jgi:hypothetical protein
MTTMNHPLEVIPWHKGAVRYLEQGMHDGRPCYIVEWTWCAVVCVSGHRSKEYEEGAYTKGFYVKVNLFAALIP